MDEVRIVGLLGFIGRDQCRRVEQAAGKVKEVQA